MLRIGRLRAFRCRRHAERQNYAAVPQNLFKSVIGRLTFDSCFKEHCLKSGLTDSPQALFPAELAVVPIKTDNAIAPD
jgi:hypothetical protein